MLHNAVGCVSVCYVQTCIKWFNLISVTRGWVGVKFQEKKRYVTLV